MFIFGDSFDYYAAISDMGAGYWDTATTGTNAALPAGRFTGSLSFGMGAIAANTVMLAKSSGSNDITHHIVCAFEQTVALSGTISGLAFTLLDGTSAQCSIVFRSDGAILCTSGASNGSTIATYTSAFSPNVWTAFEFEVVIDSTAGVFRARKNGNAVNDFQATNLNTRAGTTNSYANKLQVVFTTNTTPLNAVNAHIIDDLLWFSASGSAPNTWVGDVRAYPLLPTSDASASFSRSTTSTAITISGTGGTRSAGANVAQLLPFTPTFNGTVGTATVQLNAGVTGHLKAAIYDSTRTTPLGTSNEVTNPVTGVNTLTWNTPVAVTKSTTYYLAIDQDTTIVYVASVGSQTAYYSGTISYASFPTSSPSVSNVQQVYNSTVTVVATDNCSFVNEAQEDGTTSYVYSNSVGATDFYNVADLPGTPASILAVTTRGFGQKSDAGTRIGQMQMKSGSTTVQSGAVGLATAFTWQSRTDATDPATGQSWTTSGVNALQIGPYLGG